MQVILKKDIPQVGRIGEVVKVKPGFARNFLLPRDLALAANPANLEQFNHQKKLVDIHKKKVQKESEGVAEKLGKIKIKVQRRFNESGKMFGSLAANDLAAELKREGYTFDKRDIEVEAIKTPGSHTFKVRLPGDVFVSINLELEAQEEKSKESAKKAKTTRTKKKAEAETEEAKVEASAEAGAEEAAPKKKTAKKTTKAKKETSEEAAED